MLSGLLNVVASPDTAATNVKDVFTSLFVETSGFFMVIQLVRMAEERCSFTWIVFGAPLVLQLALIPGTRLILVHNMSPDVT